MKITGNLDLELFIKGHRPEDDDSYGIIFRFGYKYTITKNDKVIEVKEGEFDYYVISATDITFYEGPIMINASTDNFYWICEEIDAFGSIFESDDNVFTDSVFYGLIMNYIKTNKIPPNYMSIEPSMYSIDDIILELKTGSRDCGDTLQSIKDCRYKLTDNKMIIENELLSMKFDLYNVEDKDTIFENLISYANEWNKIADGSVNPSIYDNIQYNTINKFSQSFEINVLEYEYKYDERYEEFYPDGKLIFTKSSVNCYNTDDIKVCLTFMSSEDFADENKKGYETLYNDNLVGLFYEYDDEIINEIIEYYKEGHING